jgi:hypothetical protein
MFQLAHGSLYWFVQALQPLLVPICFVLAWTIVLLLGWNTWSAIRDGVVNAKRMHRIPCAGCQFFTNDHRLKCPVHPTKALSEAAINCPDYESLTYPTISYSGDHHQ